ncbi:MAG: hypothetical protein RIB43_01575 [Rhodospirillaceae bacterium]
MKNFFVVYDLRVLPPTFDFLCFICMADGLRRLSSPPFDGIDLAIIYGESLRGQEFANVASQADLILHRIHSMLLPMASLLPSIKSISVFDVKSTSASISLGDVSFPKNYSANNPELYKYYKNNHLIKVAEKIDIRALECDDASLNTARRLLKRLSGHENPVVFTLRNNTQSHDRSRDKIKEYLDIAEKLSVEFPIVIVPDTSDVACGVQTDLPICYEASIDVKIRAAIGQLSKVSFFSNNGASATSALNKKSTYYVADFATGTRFTREWMEKEGWTYNWNPFSQGESHQVYDFDSLTFEKARKFITLAVNQ